MDTNCLIYGIEIPNSDWDNTPASVRELVEKLGQRIQKSEEKLVNSEARNQELLEKINRTSKNSSSPPSSDLPGTSKSLEKKKSGKKRGGQPGHKGHTRHLYDVSECEAILDHHPETCSCCGEKLSGEDANPLRHQIVDIPPIKPIVVEHRLHQLLCNNCGVSTRAALPSDINKSGYGVGVVAVLSGFKRALSSQY